MLGCFLCSLTKIDGARALVAELLSNGRSQPLIDGANAFLHAPEFEGLRYFVAFIGGLFTFVRVVLPPVFELIKTRRLEATKLTAEGPVTYKQLFEAEVDRVLQLHYENENFKRDNTAQNAIIASLRDRNKQLAEICRAMGHALPPGDPAPEPADAATPREIQAPEGPQ